MSGNRAQIGSRGYNFGEGGYAGFGGVELVAAGRPRANSVSEAPSEGRARSSSVFYQQPEGRGRSTSIDEGYSHAVNFRKGVLFYFRHLEIMGGPLGLGYVDSKVGQIRAVDRAMNVYNPVSTVSAVNESVRNASSGVKSLIANDSSGVSMLGMLREQVLKALEEIGGSAYRAVEGVATKTSEFLEKSIDTILNQLLTEMVRLSIPIASNAIAFAKAMYGGVKATYAWVSTQSIYDVLKAGEPTMIVKSIHSRLAMEMGSRFSQAIWEAAQAVASGLTMGGSTVFTSVANAVVVALKGIYRLYNRVNDYFLFQKFSEECDTKFICNDSCIFDQNKFSDWLGDWIDKLPIIASHCLTSSVTGSYTGFMTALTQSGSDVDKDKLIRGFSDLYTLKEAGRDFIKSYPHKFASDDPIVRDSLVIVQSGSVDWTDGAAVRSLNIFRRGWLAFKSSVL